MSPSQTLLALAVAGLLVACSAAPVYETRTVPSPLTSPEQETCVANCAASRSLCETYAADDRRRCEGAHAQRLSSAEREAYSRQLTAGMPGFPLSKDCTARFFWAEQVCDDDLKRRRVRIDGRCEASYHSCYRSCGGDLMTTRVCVKNCDPD